MISSCCTQKKCEKKFPITEDNCRDEYPCNNEEPLIIDENYFKGEYFSSQTSEFKKGYSTVQLSMGNYDNIPLLLVEDSISIDSLGHDVCFKIKIYNNIAYAFDLNHCSQVPPHKINLIDRDKLQELGAYPIIDYHNNKINGHTRIDGDFAHYLAHIWPARHTGTNGKKGYINDTLKNRHSLVSICREKIELINEPDVCDANNTNVELLYMTNHLYENMRDTIALGPRNLYVKVINSNANGNPIKLITDVSRIHKH